MHTKGHADAIPDLVDRLTDLKTMLIQLRSRMPGAEVYENTKGLLIEAAYATLVNTLVAVTAGQEGFKNMENHPAHKAHKRASNIMNIIEYFKHSFQTMLVAFADMFARKMNSSTVKHTSLNTPPDVAKETIDDFAKIMDDAAETILKKQLPSTNVLVESPPRIVYGSLCQRGSQKQKPPQRL